MFWRKKRNASGSVSVQVLRKRGFRNVLVKTIGSASDEQSIIRLEKEAEAYIAKSIGQAPLPFERDCEQSWFDRAFASITRIHSVGAELILGSIYDDIGFGAIGEDLFRHLVLCRLVYPSSKLKTIRYLQETQGISYSIKTVYRYLDKLQSSQKEIVERISYQHSLKVLGTAPSILFYDVTTIYFEAEREDDLRKTGFSKDGKHRHPQILLGLLVSAGGYPMAYDIFEGNKYEGHTMLPVMDAFKQRFKLKELTVVADSGLMSADNLASLMTKGYTFIIGARLKNTKQEIQKQILSLKLKDGQLAAINYQDNQRLLVTYSEKRAVKDQKNREKGLARLEKSVASGKLSKANINNRGYNKYLKIKGNADVAIDYQAFERDAAWDGLKGYITNIKPSNQALGLNDRTILERYKELWMIEKAFRISKTDLRIRPIYHRLAHRIEAHICISFAAYKIYKELERRLREAKSDSSVERVLEILPNIMAVTIQNPETMEVRTKIRLTDEAQKSLVKSLKIDLGDPMS